LSEAAPVPGAPVPAGGYVRYRGAVRVLDALQRWLGERDRPLLVLVGEAGSGKTTLLDVFAARVVSLFEVVRVADPSIEPDELWRRVLTAMGHSPEGPSRQALANALLRPLDDPVLLMVDAADSMPPRSEMWIFDLVRRSAGSVRAIVAVESLRTATQLAAAFGAGAEILAHDTPMSPTECDSFVRSALDRAGVAPEQRARFDEALLAALHQRSGGLPGPLLREISAALARIQSEPDPEPAPPRDVAAAPAPLEVAGSPHPPESAARPTPAPPARNVELPPAPPPARPAPVGVTPHDSLLRWLLLPGALAASFVGGFVTAHLLDGLGAERHATAPPLQARSESPPPLRELPQVSAAPPGAAPAEPAEARTRDLLPAPVAAAPAPYQQPAAPAAAPVDPARAPAAEPAPEVAASPAPSLEADPAPAVAAEPPAPTPPAAAPEPAAQTPRRALARREPARAPARAQTRPVDVTVSAEPDAVVIVDGRAIGVGGAKARLERGPHHFVVRLPDGREVERVVDVQGTRFDVRFR
jgi:hypothetical protein